MEEINQVSFNLSPEVTVLARKMAEDRSVSVEEAFTRMFLFGTVLSHEVAVVGAQLWLVKPDGTKVRVDHHL